MAATNKPETTQKTSTAKKSTAKKTTAKKTSTAKKTTTASSIKLTKDEKKLIQDFRKCNDVTKSMICSAVEKISATKGAGKDSIDLGNLDLGKLTGLFGKK